MYCLFLQLRRTSVAHSVGQCKYTRTHTHALTTHTHRHASTHSHTGTHSLYTLVCMLFSWYHSQYLVSHPPSANTVAVGQTNTVQEVQEAKISSYEEALAKIKDATGVSDIQEVVDRFLNQGDTKRHLEQLREENTKVVARLKEEREKLQAQFEDLKYSGEVYVRHLLGWVHCIGRYGGGG